MKTIEIIGVPGSGKTTFATSLEHNHGMIRVKVVDSRERYLDGFYFCLMHPVFFCRFLWLLFKRSDKKPKLLKHKFLFLFLSACAMEKKVAARTGFVIDQGLFQVLLCLYDNKVSKKVITKDLLIFKQFTFERKIFLVEARSEIVKRRIHERKRVPRIEFGEKYHIKFMDDVTHNYIVMKECLKELSDIQIIKT